MTSKSLKRRKTITHKKVRNHKKTIRGGKLAAGEKTPLADDAASKDTPENNYDLITAERLSFAVMVVVGIATFVKLM